MSFGTYFLKCHHHPSFFKLTIDKFSTTKIIAQNMRSTKPWPFGGPTGKLYLLSNRIKYAEYGKIIIVDINDNI